MNIYAIIVLSAVFTFFMIFLIIKRHRIRHLAIDDMAGNEFEAYCVQILEANGFLEPEMTPPSHDFGVDILTEKDGITYAIQCKRYDSPVGIKAVQEAYAGKDYYDRMVGVVMTNQYFTGPATDMAKKLKVLLWDRGYLEEFVESDS